MEITFVVGSAGLAVLFLLAPGIDLWYSNLFYRESAGFYLRDAAWVRLLYDLVHPLAAASVVCLVGLLMHNLLRRRAVGPFSTRAVLFLLATLALGPGLVVNTLLKENWGRARPRDIEQFGGDREFTPAFVIGDQCERNCSFVSGHVAIPFALAALGYVWRRRRRAIWVGSVTLGGLVGFARIVQGAHFLSDVIFSGVFVLLVIYVLARTVFRLPERARMASSAEP